MRRVVGRWALVLTLVGGEARGANSIGSNASTPVVAQKKAPAPRLAPFPGTLEEAQKEASERNVPLVVFAVLVGEEANDRFAQTVPGDPAVAAALEGTVLVIANSGEHPKKALEETVDGKKTTRDVCSVFLTATCADHQRSWDPVFFAYGENGELQCPQVILVGADRKVSRRIAPGEVPRASQLVTAITALREKLGPGLTRAELAAVQTALAAAHKAVERADHAAAWRAFAAVIAVHDKAKYADESRAGQEKALAGLAAERDAALELLKSEQPLEGYDALLSLAERCKGLPNEKELAKLVAQAENAPATREVIAVHKKVLAAEALWKEVAELEAQNQKKKAEAKVRLLLKKYYDTEAGRKARKAYPEIAADEDKKTGG